MTLAIDIMDRHGLSNKADREFLLKEQLKMVCFHSFHSKKCLTSLVLLTRWGIFSLKLGMLSDSEEFKMRVHT